MTSRRLIALATAFAVAFSALWPLVSAARPKPQAIPNFICGQSGFHFPQELPPAHDDASAKLHCALCVALAEGAFQSAPGGPARIPIDAVEPAVPVLASPAFLWLAQPPPSRAPPSIS